MLEDRMAQIEQIASHLTPGFERDENTGALLNTDYAALMRHKSKTAQAKRLDELETLCHGLKDDMKKIQDMLGECLNKSA